MVGLALTGASTSRAGAPVVTWSDQPRDTVMRVTDSGAEASLDVNAHQLTDLLEITLGSWSPDDPADDLFDGAFSESGLFMRLDLVLAGVVNPPGPSGPLNFNPYQYGPNPVFGFVEIDVDQNVDTGGHSNALQVRYRYLGNVVRFGGMTPLPDLAPHAALGAADFDSDFYSPPFVERSGEEFHLALFDEGLTAVTIEELVGNSDSIFEEGETWNVHGAMLHLAHGFEPFLAGTGQYTPATVVQFHHDTTADETRVSLVFPLTNAAAGMMVGAAPERLDFNTSNQSSILEALFVLNLSAQFVTYCPTGMPGEDLILGWFGQSPWDYLAPTAWRVTALLGTCSDTADPGGLHYVWTDVYPDVVRGDIDGNGLAGNDDRQTILDYIYSADTCPGEPCGEIIITGFAEDFSLYDINQNGVINGIDVMLVSEPGDGDLDGDVDLADFARLQTCFSDDLVESEAPVCALFDLDTDQAVTLEDAGRWTVEFTRD